MSRKKRLPLKLSNTPYQELIRMRIAVFAQSLHTAGGQLVGTHLIAALAKTDKTNTYAFIIPDQQEYRNVVSEGSADTVHYCSIRGNLQRFFLDNLTMKRAAYTFKPDIILGLGNFGMDNPPCPQAILIHNSFLFETEKNTRWLPLMSRLRHCVLRNRLRRQLPRTDLVFCQTATMEKQLRDVCGYRGKTAVIPNVFSPLEHGDTSRYPSELTPHMDKYKLFYLTRYYPHKGIEMLVELFDRYRDELADTVAVITIDARQNANAGRLLRQVRECGLSDRIINVGPLSQQKLVDYYRACDCLVMPTRLESFSVTYLEAMHFGLPILTSDRNFAREICGPAAVYFDPWHTASIRDTVLRVKHDTPLRTSLVTHGHARLASRFARTWDDVAAEMNDHFEALVQPTAQFGVTSPHTLAFPSSHPWTGTQNEPSQNSLLL